MRLIASNVKFVRMWLMVVLCWSLVPSSLLADNESKTRSSNEQPKKLEAPKTDLTEREQWLLEKVEQLEKRVAELESKSLRPREMHPSDSPADPGGAVTNATPDSVDATPSLTAGREAIGPAPRLPTEKGKSGAGAAEKSEPFAFCRFHLAEWQRAYEGRTAGYKVFHPRRFARAWTGSRRI